MISPLVSHANKIINYVKTFRQNGNDDWYVHGNGAIKNHKFIIKKNEINRVNNLIHLGLPIRDQTHVENFFVINFGKSKEVSTH